MSEKDNKWKLLAGAELLAALAELLAVLALEPGLAEDLARALTLWLAAAELIRQGLGPGALGLRG